MMTEGASEPPRFDPTTVNTTMHKYHDTMPKATTTEDKEGENKQRKDDSCFPAINHFYKRTWYPFYVIETTVEHFATKHTAYNPTTVTHCTGQTVPDPTTYTSTVLATHQTVTNTVTEPTAPELTVTNPTSNNPTVLLPTVSKSTVPDPTVPNPTMPKSTVTEPTVLKHTVTPTTVPQSPVGATPKTLMTELTTTQLNLTEAYLNRYTTMTLYKFFPHCSHPPYPEKVKQQFHHNIV